MRVCYCCLRTGRDQCDCTCSVECCRRCGGLCTHHCACANSPLRRTDERPSAAYPHVDLDDPNGPFADLADEPLVVEPEGDFPEGP